VKRRQDKTKQGTTGLDKTKEEKKRRKWCVMVVGGGAK
jgi:hypothetical protein